MHINYQHTDDTGLLSYEYDLRIEFGFSPMEPGSRDEPPIPAHTYDEKITAASVAIGHGKPIQITEESDLRELNRWLDPSNWLGERERLESRVFVFSVQQAIAEHLDEQDKAARESAAEAKFQAMRDGQ